MFILAQHDLFGAEGVELLSPSISSVTSASVLLSDEGDFQLNCLLSYCFHLHFTLFSFCQQLAMLEGPYFLFCYHFVNADHEAETGLM